MNAWNSTLPARRKPLNRGTIARGCPRKPPKPRKALPKLGSVGKRWQVAWRELKPRFERAGITTCELRLPGCMRDNFLTPAHSLKRRNCVTQELLREVCLACVNCHNRIEALPEMDMAVVVRHTIDARPVPI